LITTTHEPPTIQVDETTLQPDVSTQSIGQYADSHAVCIAAQYPGTATIEDEAESTSAAEPSSLYLPIQVERQAIYRPGRPQKDPALSPRARTRLRVQQHRDQQYLTKAQQIVQQFGITQELPPTVEFSGLTLHDGPALSISANEAQPGPECRPDGEPDPESEVEPILFPPSPSHLTAYNIEDGNDGGISESFGFDNDAISDLSISTRPSLPDFTRHSSQLPERRGSTSSSTPSPPASLPSPLSSPSSIPSVGRDESILSGYLQAINEQDTAGGPDFLRQQGDIYDRVLRTFFSHQCNCMSQIHHLSAPRLLELTDIYLKQARVRTSMPSQKMPKHYRNIPNISAILSLLCRLSLQNAIVLVIRVLPFHSGEASSLTNRPNPYRCTRHRLRCPTAP
jgi:hypothetical protein